MPRGVDVVSKGAEHLLKRDPSCCMICAPVKPLLKVKPDVASVCPPATIAPGARKLPGRRLSAPWAASVR
eukprot:5425228-Prymnesium_polylepis.1